MFKAPYMLLPYGHLTQCFSLLHMTLWHGSSTFYLNILLLMDSQVASNLHHTDRTAVNTLDMPRSQWPYRRGPECRWCHLEGVHMCWVRWKHSWDTSEHQGQRSEKAPMNGQIHGQQQETSCNLKRKHVWWMAPSISKCGGNMISRNVASGPKLPGEIALPLPAFCFFPFRYLKIWRLKGIKVGAVGWD